MKGMFGNLLRGVLKLALNAILAYIIISTLVLLLNINIPELPNELNSVAPPEVKSALYIIGAFSLDPGWIIFAWVLIVLAYLMQCYFERSGAPYSIAQFVVNFFTVSKKRKSELRKIPERFPIQDSPMVTPEFQESFNASLEDNLKGWPFHFPPSEMFDVRYSASVYDSSHRDTLPLILLDEVITDAMAKGHGGMDYLRLRDKNYGKRLRDHWGAKLGIIARPLDHGPGSGSMIILVNGQVCNSVVVEPMLDAMSGMESIIDGRADDEELQQYNKAISHLKVLGRFHKLPGKNIDVSFNGVGGMSAKREVEEWIADEVRDYLPK